MRARRAALVIGFGLLLLAIGPSKAGLVATETSSSARSIAVEADHDAPVVRAVLSAAAPLVAKGDERRERLVLPALLAVVAAVLIGDPRSRRRYVVAVASASKALVRGMSDGQRAPPTLLAI